MYNNGDLFEISLAKQHSFENFFTVYFTKKQSQQKHKPRGAQSAI